MNESKPSVTQQWHIVVMGLSLDKQEILCTVFQNLWFRAIGIKLTYWLTTTLITVLKTRTMSFLQQIKKRVKKQLILV